ncbi:MAG: hypothetical protein U1D32_00525, partial [Patescibacteria group bacterium]|nr:hypothetical protein [Patescibacteria group bacterium]
GVRIPVPEPSIEKVLWLWYYCELCDKQLQSTLTISPLLLLAMVGHQNVKSSVLMPDRSPDDCKISIKGASNANAETDHRSPV